jgi:hypothetical protein
MRVLVCGDRLWTDRRAVEAQIVKLLSETDDPERLMIIEGGALGADRIAWEIAKQYRLLHMQYRAEWEKYGRAAGPIRNRRMLDEGKPDLVLAFHHNLNASKGTANMVLQAHRAGVPVVVCGGRT